MADLSTKEILRVMKQDTTIVTEGRHPEDNFGIINPPVYHASTVLHPTVEHLEQARRDMRDPYSREVFYGLHGTPTSFALQDVVMALEGGVGCALYPSGLAAITGALCAFLEAGAHLLMSDSVYGPSRTFCDGMLKRFGVETTYYDPLIGGAIKDLMQPNTKVVFIESPGSLTFEVQDVPAIAAAAHHHGAVVVMDNTWATPLYFKPFEKGVDVSIQAATKYIVGHSDAMLGTAVAGAEHWPALKSCTHEFGFCAGPDDVYLAQRGIRTMSVRLERHARSALALAQWLEQRPEVARVLYPPLASDPGHDLWKRDFTGACGLFGVILKPAERAAVAAMLDGLELFGMGASWGGYESLILPTTPGRIRTATNWAPEGPSLRIHVGLEDIDDLIRDLDLGFKRLRNAG